MSRRLGPLFALVALFAALAFIATEAEARSRGSIGSRGTRTYSAPAPTATAPGTARPLERSMTQPGVTAPGPATTPATPATSGGFFGRPGLLGGLAAGFLGAGLIGMLMGNGFLGGLGNFASIIGLLLQVALVVIVARLLWAWWQRRNQPAFAGGPSLRDAAPNGSGVAALPAGGGTARPSTDADEIGLASSDFDAFERLLGEVQTAYGAEDLSVLRARVTPEMLSYFSEELSENASRGVINQLSDIKLLQGDLSEAWREGDVEYATVAMRYAIVDRTVERASGRLVEGDANPQQATELWTFMRVRGGQWLLAAIQQV
jgi:predicted lipid-binding transport protein (Tim44 family)